MKDSTYKNSFALFLKRTDEKVVIRNFITDNIDINNKMAFLDIGAGDGSLSSMISKKVKSTVAVEPNKDFCESLSKKKNIKVLNETWEDVHLEGLFDFILVSHVVTYFPKTKRKKLIKKMYNVLNSGGKILILSIDAKKGSWRKIHDYFFKLMNRFHCPSDFELKQIMREYGAVSRSFKTRVIAKDQDEMLKILGFDFYDYTEYFEKYSTDLKKFLKKHTGEGGKVTLETVHNAYIVTKK